MLSTNLLQEINTNSLSPMMKQWYDIKSQNLDCLIFFRLGDFYELFYDDALEASRVLEITLTQRDCGQEKKAPMCGVPFHAVETYLNKLLQQNYKVAICEQTQDPQLAKGLVERKLTKYITPGTLTEVNSLKAEVNNYLMAVYQDNFGHSLALADITTGIVRVSYLAKDFSFNSFIEEIIKYKPAEVLFLDDASQTDLKEALIREGLYLTSFLPSDFCELKEDDIIISSSFLPPLLFKDEVLAENTQNLKLSACSLKVLKNTLKILYSYIWKTQQNIPDALKNCEFYEIDTYLFLPNVTQKSLEIFESLKYNSKKDSLLDLLDKCQTAMGSRLIKRMLEQILLNKSEIEKRQNCVEIFKNNYTFRENLRNSLKKIADLERLSLKLQNKNINPRQFLQLAGALENSLEIINLISEFQTEKSLFLPINWHLNSDVVDLKEQAQFLIKAFLDSPPLQIKEGSIFRDTYHPLIEEYRNFSTFGKQKILELEQDTKQKYSIKTMKIGYNRIFGYYFEVANSSLHQVPSSFMRKQTLANSERFITEELKNLEDKVLSSQTKLLTLEYSLFIELRDKYADYASDYLALAKDLASIDVFLSLAHLADSHNYVKPQLSEDTIFLLEQARHPILDSKDVGSFVPNDLFMDANVTKLLLITGPNMGGKSTYMRQAALITIMAQLGSFVPAKSANIGICDRIFTRIGASDDLSSGKSTFMVEMAEMSYILKNLTRRSFVLLDEVGRGTSTSDGLSLATAITEYLLKSSLNIRVLFATHYHELVNLSQKYTQMLNYHVAVSSEGNNLCFLHQIKQGASDESFGIEVAELAGLPKSLIKKAKNILKNIKTKNENTPFLNQLNLIEEKENEVDNRDDLIEAYKIFLRTLAKVDLNNCTPLEAFQLLNKYQIEANSLLIEDANQNS